MNVSSLAPRRLFIKGLKGIAQSQTMLTSNLKNVSTPAKYAAGLAVTSVCVKDAVGCYYYVTQSLNNKKIPKEKRNFVAALDLANGFFNITTQLLLSKLLLSEKVLDKGHEALYKAKTKSKEARTFLSDHFYKKIIPKTPREKIDKAVRDATRKLFDRSRVGFGTVISLVVTSVIAKRMLVPLFATPLAGTIEKKYMSKGDDKNFEPGFDKISFSSQYKLNPFLMLKEMQKAHAKTKDS